jgi:transcription elongation factor GreA
MELPIMQQLKKELEGLRYELNTKLPRELEKARAHGDLSENAEYEAAKERQGFVSARIGQLEQRVRELSMYSLESIPHDVVAYGSQVTLENLDDGETETYEMVFPEEVSAAAGQISLGSPMGRALMNKEVGDEVEVRTPKGRRTFEIIALRTLHQRNETNPE